MPVRRRDAVRLQQERNTCAINMVRARGRTHEITSAQRGSVSKASFLEQFRTRIAAIDLASPPEFDELIAAANFVQVLWRRRLHQLYSRDPGNLCHRRAPADLDRYGVKPAKYRMYPCRQLALVIGAKSAGSAQSCQPEFPF
jgi:hypothetical protein